MLPPPPPPPQTTSRLLDGLPREVLNGITDYLEDGDLAALTLTCKRAYEAWFTPRLRMHLSTQCLHVKKLFEGISRDLHNANGDSAPPLPEPGAGGRAAALCARLRPGTRPRPSAAVLARTRRRREPLLRLRTVYRLLPPRSQRPLQSLPD
ncbi:hypothetical protein PG996_014823 [Apiospora saccharicola]|uniref:F-box domain-containing protein n=1 Tax=Apiospora saccharicola TaxID=335842 RepID=A0ABR1TM26_9PEZI